VEEAQPLTRFEVEFDPRTEPELKRLTRKLQRRLREKLEYLAASPFRSHPEVAVKPTGEVDGIWHFHLGKRIRVYYMADGSRLIVMKVEEAAGVDSKVLDELRRRRKAV
jgi:mRNA-degrading endonuclease RelE of RelBE toxin-antitoxin system